MFIKKLLVAIAFVGLGSLLMSTTKTFSSTMAPVSAELQKYPVITGTTAESVSVSGITSGTALQVSGTAVTLTAAQQFPALPITGATLLSDTLYNVWNSIRIQGLAPTLSTDHSFAHLIARLNNIKLDNGFINLYPYSSALLNEYNRSHSKELLDYAILLSPAMPEPYFNLSYSMFKSGSSHYSKASMYLSRAVHAFFQDPYNILRFISNRLINLSLTVFAVFFIFAILLLARYSMQIHALMKDSMPEYIPEYVIVLISLVIVVLPLLYGMGFLWLLFLWLAITIAYQKFSERVFSIVFIIIMVLLTHITLVAVATVLKPAEEPFTGIMDINYGNLTRNGIQELTSYADNHASDLYSNLYAGVYYKRIGLYDRASVYYRRLQDNGYGGMPIVICNIGNLEYATGNVAAAGDDYQKAIAINHDFFPAHYNLGQLYLIKANIEGTNELDIARGIAPELFAYYASIYEKSNTNRIFADALPDPKMLAYSMFTNTLNSHTARELADIIMSRLITWPPARYLQYLAFFFLVVFFILILFSSRIKRHLRCKSCGRIYTITSNRNDEYKDILCVDCLRFHIKNDIKESKKKVEITQRVHKWKRSLKSINIAVSALLPGSGYILRGQTVKGMSVLFALICLIVEYISSFGLIAFIFPLSNPFIPVLKLMVIIALTVLYLLNLFLSIKSEVRWY